MQHGFSGQAYQFVLKGQDLQLAAVDSMLWLTFDTQHRGLAAFF